MAEKKPLAAPENEQPVPVEEEPTRGLKVDAPVSNGSSLPDRPMEFDFDPSDMTLDEAVLFEPDGFSARAFRQLLIDHSNWTRQEIGKIKVRDLENVAKQLVAKINEAAVPNGS